MKLSVGSESKMPTNKKPVLSIIIPVYHEEKNIGRVLTRIRRAVKTPHVIFIIYDRADDPTVKVAKKYKVRLVKNSIGNGRGVMNAIKTGFGAFKTTAVVVTMADLCDDVSQIDEMYKLLRSKYDIVCASRYMPGGKKIGGPFVKTLLSRAAGLSLHYIFGVPTHDATNAFKMYRRDIIRSIEIKSTGGFEYSLELVLKAFKKGYRIGQIPTRWVDREAGKSKFKLLSWLPGYIKSYFSILYEGKESK